MKTTRQQFEEIWPVPEGIEWSMNIGRYICNDKLRMTQDRINKCIEWDARLDTFTRCQDTMAPVISLVDELVKDLEEAYEEYTDVHGDMAITKAKAWLRSNK